MRSAINTLLVVFSLMIALLASAFAEASCAVGVRRNAVSWVFSKYGDAPYICAASCKSVLKAVSVCFPDADSCTGDFITDGSTCPDSDGVVAGGNFPDPDSGGGDNGGGDNGGGDGGVDSDMPASFDAIEHAVKNLMDRWSDEQYMALSSLEAARWSVQTFRKLEQLRTEHFADMDAALNTIMHRTNSMESKMDSINTKANTIATNTTSAATNLNEIKNKLDQLIENTTPEEEPDCTPRPFPELPPPECIPRPSGVEQRLDGINNTLINNAVTDTLMSQEIKGAVEGLGSGITSISDGIGDIKDSLSKGDYLHRAPEGEIDFGDMPLYQPSAIEELEAETKELEAKYDEKVKQFKNVFSLDESRLQNGEFNNHSTQFTIASGQTITGMSAVFPALVDVSHWIAAAILFVAIVAGVRQLGN